MNIAQAEKNPKALKFRIPGRPTPLARPRMHRDWVFDPQKSRKLVIGISLREQMDNRPLYDEPLVLFMDFYFPPRINWSKTKQQEYSGKPYKSRPDADNCIKWICDVFNEIVYHDDSVVCAIIARKMYGDARTEIVLLPWIEYEKHANNN